MKRRQRPTSFRDDQGHTWQRGTLATILARGPLHGRTLNVVAIDPYMQLVAVPADPGGVYWYNTDFQVAPARH